MIRLNRISFQVLLPFLVWLSVPAIASALANSQKIPTPLMTQGLPRVLILITSETEQNRKTDVALNSIGSALAARGYSVDTHFGASESRAMARDMWKGQTSDVLAIAKKAGDEIVIAGSVSGTAMVGKNLGGLVGYRATIEIRAYSVGTGNLISNTFEAASGLDVTSEAAMIKATAGVAEKVGNLFADRNQNRAPALVVAATSGTKSPLSDVDKPQYTTPENPNNFAVIVGVEKYASLPTAEFADRDAEAVRANLMALGYPTRNIYFLSGQQATRAKIDQALNTWLPNRVSNKSTVFFYYSGHGAPNPKDNQAYLVPVDGDAEDLESTAYPIKQLYAKLGDLKAHHVIVALDSCFSGAGGRSVLAKGTRPLITTIDLGSLPNNVIALTASDKNEISGTIEDQGHGAFTYYMLKGLAGAAKNDSGAVTVQSLYDYLKPKVQDAARLRNRDQTPQLLPAGGDRTGTILR